MSLGAPPIQGPVVASDKQFDQGWKRWLAEIFGVLQAVQNYGKYSVTVPVNGFTISWPSSAEVLQLAPAGPLAAGTVTLPTTPVDKQRITISTTQAIAALTIATGAIPILNPATTLAAGQAVSYYYSLSSNAWYPLQTGVSGGGGGSASVAGAATQVQFNYAGGFFAVAGFAYNPVTNVLTVPKITAGAIDSSPIGNTTPAAGSFTTLNAQSLGFVEDANLNLAVRAFTPRPRVAVLPDLADTQAILVNRIFRK